MQDADTTGTDAHSEGQLELFERFLALPTGNLELTLSGAADLVARSLEADKVDVFVHDLARSSLVALGTSQQPLSALQRSVGLDVLSIANGGSAARAFQTGELFLSGTLTEDPEELRGVREILQVESHICVRLEVGAQPYGVLAVASRTRNRWTAQHANFARAVARWVGIVAHRAQLAAELERRAVEESRRQAAEELVMVVAHDVRNHLSPLGFRLGTLCQRAKRDGREDDMREIDRAQVSLRRLASLVDDLLDVARIDHGLFEMHREEVDLSAMVADVASLQSTSDKTVQVRSPAPLSIQADGPRIRQCLENLIANALTYCPSGAAVVVNVASEAHPEGPFARVEVIDEGPGIPEHVLPHVFERFVRGKRSTKGLGLGLYLAKRIATLHGGDLGVDSSPGRGSRFVLRLPVRT